MQSATPCPIPASITLAIRNLHPSSRRNSSHSFLLRHDMLSGPCKPRFAGKAVNLLDLLQWTNTLHPAR